jgi:hypothetical protein
MNGKALMRKLYVIVAAGALLALAAGVSFAAIPSSNGTITGCVGPSGGNLKVINAEAGASCANGQKQLSWNQQGPAGENGVSGYETVYAKSDVNSANTKTVFASCPPGKKVLGGGAGVYGEWTAEGQNIVDGVALVQDHPFNDNGWGARADEFIPTADNWYLFVKITCADVS